MERDVKPIEFSRSKAKYIVMPQHANPSGLMFGGILMSWIDMLAAIVAEKHSGKDVATIHVNEIGFKAPIRVGEHVLLDAYLTDVGESSMKIAVLVEAEDVKLKTKISTTKAVLTFVAVDKNMQPTTVPLIE